MDTHDMNPVQEKIGVIDNAEPLGAKYHSVYCDACDWSQSCWLGREAEVRGQVHEDAHGEDHLTWVVPVTLVDQDLPELGFEG